MRSDLKAMADDIVALILKHGGTLASDGETICFSRLADAAAFNAELSISKKGK